MIHVDAHAELFVSVRPQDLYGALRQIHPSIPGRCRVVRLLVSCNPSGLASAARSGVCAESHWRQHFGAPAGNHDLRPLAIMTSGRLFGLRVLIFRYDACSPMAGLA